MRGFVGRMRERITIQAENPSADNYGGYSLSWSDVTTVWGRVQPLRGAEQYEAMRTEAQTQYTIRIRYYSGLTEKHRFKLGTRVFNIRAILNTDEHGMYQECLCEEGTIDGSGDPAAGVGT